MTSILRGTAMGQYRYNSILGGTITTPTATMVVQMQLQH